MKDLEVILHKEANITQRTTVRLTDEQATFLREHPNASELVRQAIKREMEKQRQKEGTAETVRKLAEIATKYGFAWVPDWNQLEKCNGTYYPSDRYYEAKGTYTTEEWLEQHRKARDQRREGRPSPQHFFDYFLCTGGTSMDEPTLEEEEILVELNKIDIPKRQEIIRQALEKALEKSEIKKGYPLIKFVADHIMPSIGKKIMPALSECMDVSKDTFWEDRPIKNHFTIKELADKAGMKYQHFYDRVLPKLKKMLECQALDHVLE